MSINPEIWPSQSRWSDVGYSGGSTSQCMDKKASIKRAGFACWLQAWAGLSQRPAACLLLGFCLLLLRAWPRLIYPDVWNEDGDRNVLGYLRHGLLDLFSPDHSYLILVPKLITGLAMSMSPTHYPFVSTVLAWIFILYVYYSVASAPLVLRGGGLLAGLMFLIPANPEVFGLPLYTFWWAAILVMILPFYRPDAPVKIRFLHVVLGFLSSPIGFIVLPLLWLRVFYLGKSRMEVGVALVATGCAVWQALAMYLDNIAPETVPFRWESLCFVVPKFFGGLLTGNLSHGYLDLSGMLLLGGGAAGLYLFRKEWPLWALVYLLAATILVALLRSDVEQIDAGLAAPRYFFYPFILTFWLLVQLVYLMADRRVAGGVILFLMWVSVANAIPVLYRKHDRLYWSEQLFSCVHFSEYSLPVHRDGLASHAMRIAMTRAQCAALLDADRFKSSSSSTFAYRVLPYEPEKAASKVTVGLNAIQAGSQWTGADRDRSVLPGFRVFGSYVTSSLDKGAMKVRMRKGDKILYRPGPLVKGQTIEVLGSDFMKVSTVGHHYWNVWVVLDFSNDTLPDEFDVRFSDERDTDGAWSAVAVLDKR